MMILSRIWYVILALLLAAAYYVVALAVGQYNRRNQAAMEETLKADSQVVSWAMQVDARRRLDLLLLAATDQNIGKALKGANGKDTVAASAKEEGQKALQGFAEKLPAEYKADVLFLVDREGRLVSQIGYDAVNGSPQFELGGYPAVFDALHGFLRDDTWVWGGKIARVVTRPVEDEAGQPPLGAVVAMRWVDNSYAKEVGKRTRTNLAFFALGMRVASAANTEGFDDASLEALGADLKSVAEDKGFRESGRTDVRPLAEEKGGVLYVRIPGDSWELGAGFAVARPKVAISSPTGFLTGADDTDKKNVKLWLVGVILAGAALFGILFSYLEHSMPMKALAREADSLKTGKTDALQLPKVRGAYRAIASDINAGIQRVIEKGGGAGRKPADLESILGPVPAQPNMSAFSFPLNDASAPPHVPTVPGGPSSTGSHAGAAPSPPGAGGTAGRPPFPGQAPPAPGSRPAATGNAAPAGGTPFPAPDRTMAMTGGGANVQSAFGGAPAATGGVPSATVAASPAANKMPPPPFPGGTGANKKPAKDDSEDPTMVAPPGDALASASGAHPPAAGASADPTAEWQKVYEDFIRTKKECGEPTDGLTFEKFQGTLKKNRDALMQRHGCKRVKFSVYVKEGRASLKATPVRD
ncbi:MAG: hypothetical protein KIT84_01340 [Labilithrix sp.]|nr:hypothetical protein [Labilithrix sp.]MCW5809630.1 hypothetical protein [Labilithrix sp.]